MPLVLGGLGLRSACRVSQPACWASWADALHVIHNRHPEVAAQHEASSWVEQHFRASLFTRVPEQVWALVRSQAGFAAGAALTVAPTSRETTIPSHLFRVILLRRLRQALPLSVRNCRRGHPLDFSGHHRSTCARAGMLGRRGYALESVAARIVARPVDVSEPICLSGTWIWGSTRQPENSKRAH